VTTRLGALAAAVAVALAAGAEAPAKLEGRLFGLVGTKAGQFLLEVDPDTLVPLPNRRLKLAAAGDGAPWALDPTRRFAAVSRNGRLRVVDLWGLRFAGGMALGRMQTSAILWPRRDRIVVLQRSLDGHQAEALVIDRHRWRVLRRQRLPGGYVVAAARSTSELLILRSPPHVIAEASMLIVSVTGVREIALPRVRAGAGWRPDVDPPVGEHVTPGLAVDWERRVAYVVAPDGLVAEVPLDGDAVSYRALAGRYAKVLAGSRRVAHFVAGALYVSGEDTVLKRHDDGSPGFRSTPVGLDVIDTRRWTIRRVAAGVSSIAPWTEGLLATGAGADSQAGTSHAIGLVVHGLDGTERLRVLGDRQVFLAQVYGARAYVHAAGDELPLVVDLHSGRVTRRAGELPWLLLPESAPVW
jgi:hypothetical protein